VNMVPAAEHVLVEVRVGKGLVGMDSPEMTDALVKKKNFR